MRLGLCWGNFWSRIKTENICHQPQWTTGSGANRRERKGKQGELSFAAAVSECEAGESSSRDIHSEAVGTIYLILTKTLKTFFPCCLAMVNRQEIGVSMIDRISSGVKPRSRQDWEDRDPQRRPFSRIPYKAPKSKIADQRTVRSEWKKKFINLPRVIGPDRAEPCSSSSTVVCLLALRRRIYRDFDQSTVMSG